MNIPRPRSSLSEFLAEYPLYSKFGVNQPIEAADLVKLEFDFFCKNENGIQDFRLEVNSQHGNGVSLSPNAEQLDFTEMFSGFCQSCKSYKVDIILSGGSQKEKPKYFIQKIGQYPAPDILLTKLPKDVYVFLENGSRELYAKAVKNLDMEYGAGALTYFQKAIDAEMSRIIQSISNPWSDGQSRIHEAVSAYKKNGQKSKLAEDITLHLPGTLKEHGANILLMLQDASAANMQDLTEEECMKKAKDIDSLFRYLIRKINEAKSETIPTH